MFHYQKENMNEIKCENILKTAICKPDCIFPNGKIQLDCISCKYKDTNQYYKK